MEAGWEECDLDAEWSLGNHSISPFAAYGASLALKDGSDLAAQICKAKSPREAASAYDQISVLRAEKVRDTSHMKIQTSHSEGAWFILSQLFPRIGRFILWLKGRSKVVEGMKS